jgi:hypothetical protein
VSWEKTSEGTSVFLIIMTRKAFHPSHFWSCYASVFHVRLFSWQSHVFLSRNHPSSSCTLPLSEL